MTKLYRGVPLPKHCTREVLREMKKEIKFFSTFTCWLYSRILCMKISNRVTTKQEWSEFLNKLGIDTGGSGFEPHRAPYWLREKYNKPTNHYCYRYDLISDILKECYK